MRAGRLVAAVVILLVGAAGTETDPLRAAVSSTPVADAARDGEAAAVESLLAAGADASAAHGDGMSPLHWAAQRGDAALASMLIAAGADVAAVTRIGLYTPLHVASREGATGVARALVAAGADVGRTTSTTGVTALHLAAAGGRPELVRLLVEHGADPDAREATWGQTPLIFAASLDRVEAITALLAAGADPALTSHTVDLVADADRANAARDRQRAVLESFATSDESALTSSQVEAAVQMARAHYLAAEADEPTDDDTARAPSILFKGGLTPLLHAARQGYLGATTALLDGGADIDQPGESDGTTPLLMAAINAQFDLAVRLIDRGADPNLASTLNGVTPLWAVVNAEWQPRTRFPQPQEHGLQAATYLDVMTALLEAGADPDARLTMHPWYMVYSGCGNRNCGLVDTRGSTAFWRAAYATDVAAMELLVAHGADPDIPTEAPAPRRARRGTVAENEADQVATDVPLPAPGLWVATDLSTMGPDPSGLPPYEEGDPGVYPLHAAAGVGYGEGFAANAHRHVPGGWLPAIRYLIELGADVNERDHNGYNAVHHAAARGDNELILFLVEQGADVTAVSRRGQTTADMANGPVQRVSPMPETVALLEQLGSKNNHNCVSC